MTKDEEKSFKTNCSETGSYVHPAQACNCLRKCTVCENPTDLACVRCNTPYCGKECQSKAWAMHRIVCGRPRNKPKKLLATPTQDGQKESKLDTIKNSTGRFLLDRIRLPAMPLNGDIVHITAIIKVNVVFIRSNSEENKFHFQETHSELQKIAHNLKKLDKVPIMGQIVVTKFGEQYNRAMIINTKNKANYIVNYIDYGNLDVKNINELYAAPKKFMELERFAIPVVLKNVSQNVTMTNNLRKFMLSYLNDIDLRLEYDTSKDYDESREVYEVNLIDVASNRNFNESIGKLCEVQESDVANHNDLQALKMLPFPEGDNVELIIMDITNLSVGIISCTIKPYAIEIQKLQNNLQRYGDRLNKESYFTPHIDDLCLFKYPVNNKWYRGRCLKHVDNALPTLLFIDYGTVTSVSVNNIRQYPIGLKNPIYISNCEIQGMPEYRDTNFEDNLKRLVTVGSTIKCDSVQYMKSYYNITISQLTKKVEDPSSVSSSSI